MFPEISRDDVFRLETRRLWMRWPAATDAANIAKYASDFEVARWLTTVPHPYPSDAADAYIRRAREENLAGSALHCALTLKARPQNLIGVVSLICIDEHRARLRYWLGAPYWGVGFISEALSEFLLYLRRFSGLGEIEAEVMAENQASRNALKKLGFLDLGETQCFAPARGESVKARKFKLSIANLGLSPEISASRIREVRFGPKPSETSDG